MRFRSDLQRRAVFSNMANSFARKPSEKMVRDLLESTHEPVSDFRQLVPSPGAESVDVVMRGEPGLSSVREYRRDVITTAPEFPEHGYKFFTPETSGSLEEAKMQAKSVAEVITGGNAIGWVEPIWVDRELSGYTVRLKNIDTGEDLLEQDTTVYEDIIDDV